MIFFFQRFFLSTLWSSTVLAPFPAAWKWRTSIQAQNLPSLLESLWMMIMLHSQQLTLLSSSYYCVVDSLEPIFPSSEWWECDFDVPQSSILAKDDRRADSAHEKCSPKVDFTYIGSTSSLLADTIVNNFKKVKKKKLTFWQKEQELFNTTNWPVNLPIEFSRRSRVELLP